MKFLELTVTTTVQAEELVADIFWKYTDYGVAVSSVKDVIELTENKKVAYDYIDTNLLAGNAGVSLVKGFLPVDGDETCKAVYNDLERLRMTCKGNIETGTLECVKRIIDGDDWIEVWRKHFKPICFGKITVCPEWIKFDGDGEVVYLDSNMAFGTGEHETTAMCIDYLERYIRPSDVVLDVGTGSGILGIAAAKLGASKVLMTDNDPVAVKSANENILKNGVDTKCKAYLANLLDGFKECSDIVVANITAEVLDILAEDIDSYVRKGGKVILSGILKDRLSKVESRYSRIGFGVLKRETRGEWCALVLTKN